jgi:ATP-dependent Zn protease
VSAQEAPRCIFRNVKCRPRAEEPRLSSLYSEDIGKFIHEVCTMCVKKQYASTKELLARKKYVVVNTL